MALNKEFFDSIDINLVKKKYYNAGKVQALLQDIQAQAEALYAENQELKAQLRELNKQKEEIGSAVLSAHSVYNSTVNQAEQRAQEIIGEAVAQRDTVLEDAAKQQEFAVNQVNECYSKVKAQYEACIELINSNWQDYLCSLPAQGDIPVTDIGEKVGAIAQELFSIDSIDEED